MAESHGLYEVIRNKAREVLAKVEPAAAEDTFQWYSFPQAWGSTAGAGGGVGGQTITNSQTFVFIAEEHNCAVVVQGYHLYVVRKPNQRFWSDLQNQSLKNHGGLYRGERSIESEELD